MNGLLVDERELTHTNSHTSWTWVALSAPGIPIIAVIARHAPPVSPTPFSLKLDSEHPFLPHYLGKHIAWIAYIVTWVKER